MLASKAFLGYLAVSFVQAEDTMLPQCALNCVNNSRPLPPTDKCPKEDPTCICNETWGVVVHQCASIGCNVEDTKRADGWVSERCASVASPPTILTTRANDLEDHPSPLPSFSSATATPSVSISHTAASSFVSSLPTLTTNAMPSKYSSRPLTPSSTDTPTSAASYSATITPTSHHHPSKTTIALAVGIPITLLFITAILVLFCCRKRLLAAKAR